jgi:hypothetical protein
MYILSVIIAVVAIDVVVHWTLLSALVVYNYHICAKFEDSKTVSQTHVTQASLS